MAPSRHDWKIVDWDVKPQHNQPTFASYVMNCHSKCAIHAANAEPQLKKFKEGLALEMFIFEYNFWKDPSRYESRLVLLSLFMSSNYKCNSVHAL